MNPPRQPEEARTRKNATFPPDIKGKTLLILAMTNYTMASLQGVLSGCTIPFVYFNLKVMF